MASIGAGEPGLIAGCPYGVATAARDALGAARWTFHSDALGPDERYTNALLVDPNDESRWLAGSEAGVLVYSDSGAHADRSDLWDVPVRALYYTCDRFGPAPNAAASSAARTDCTGNGWEAK